MWGRAQQKKKKRGTEEQGRAQPAKSESCDHSLSILFFPPLFAFGYESELHAIVLDPQDKSRSVYYKSKVWVGKRGAPGISKKKRERRERRKVVGRGRKRKRDCDRDRHRDRQKQRRDRDRQGEREKGVTGGGGNDHHSLCGEPRVCVSL